MLKKCIVMGLLVGTLYGCSFVPRTCVMRNPETGHEVLLSKQSVYAGWYGVGVALAQRHNQKELIEALKARGYVIVHESKAGL